MERISIGESNNVKILGRTTYTEEKLNLFWTASGIELDTPATEMYIDVETDFEKYEPWVEIYVDGELSQKRMVDKGVSRIYILRKMDPGKVRNIRFIKCTQPHPSDKREMFRILGIGADADPVPMKKRPVRIEFIGDSITSGEGLHGAYGEMSNTGAMFAVDGSYHSIIAKELDADATLFSMCGYGVYSGWCGMTKESMPQYYGQVCGVTDSIYDDVTGSHEKWDHSLFRPDIVIINLGTNDSGSIDMSGQYVEDKNWNCPVKINEDGSVKEEALSDITGAVISFLKELRKIHPDAMLIWCYGMIRGRLDETLKDAVHSYRRETGDNKAFYVSLPETKKEEFGSRFHPGRQSHKHAAEMILDTIRKIQNGGSIPEI